MDEIQLVFEGIMSSANFRNENIPKTIFHYTTPEGLYGILQNKNIWLTDLRYLNDPDEIKHGITTGYTFILDKLIDKTGIDVENAKKSSIGNFLQQLVAAKKHINELSPKYCISFTKDGDLLSQWKGYGNYGFGYSIGFNSDMFLKNHLQFCFLGSVVYNEQVKTDILENIWTKISAILDKPDINPSISSLLVELIIIVSSFFKSEFFKEEEEIRLVKMVDSGSTETRVDNSFGLVPYVIESVDPLDNYIDRIITGPKIDYKLNKSTLKKWINKDKVISTSNKLRS